MYFEVLLALKIMTIDLLQWDHDYSETIRLTRESDTQAKRRIVHAYKIWCWGEIWVYSLHSVKMEVQETHLEIIDTETKKQSSLKELFQPAIIGTANEIAKEINARSDFAAKRSILRFAVVNIIEQALFMLKF